MERHGMKRSTLLIAWCFIIAAAALILWSVILLFRALS
jgi:hypothetical protein